MSVIKMGLLLLMCGKMIGPLVLVQYKITSGSVKGGPGHWSDPDMMIVGNVATGTGLHPTNLTPDEQYSHVSIFSLLAAPMLIGCPLDQLEDSH